MPTLPTPTSCLKGDTEILTEFGNIRIQELVNCQRSLRVWTCNLESEQFQLKPILGWHRTNSSVENFIKFTCLNPGIYASSRRLILECTKDHEIYTDLSWVMASKIRKHNIAYIDSFLPQDLYGREFTSKSAADLELDILWKPFEKISTSYPPIFSLTNNYEYAYNLTVEGNHNFVANGILVHNCN